MNMRMPQALPGDAAASPPQAGGARRSAPAAAAVLPGAAQTETAATPQSRQPDKEQLEQAMENLKRANQTTGQNLQFSVDGDTGKTIITVVDRDTKEVIRQIPSEEILALARNIDRLQGLLFKQEA